MSNEIKLNGTTTGGVAYAVIERGDGQIWRTDTSVFEAYSSANWANYALTLTEQASSGRFRGNFPTGIVAAGKYNVSARQRLGATAALTDTFLGSGSIEWSGTAEVVQSGDIYARIGAPSGASLSADIAAVKTDTTAIVGHVDTVEATLATLSSLSTSIAGYTDGVEATQTAQNAALTALQTAVDLVKTYTDTVEAAIGNIEGGLDAEQTRDIIDEALADNPGLLRLVAVEPAEVPLDPIPAVVDTTKRRVRVDFGLIATDADDSEKTVTAELVYLAENGRGAAKLVSGSDNGQMYPTGKIVKVTVGLAADFEVEPTDAIEPPGGYVAKWKFSFVNSGGKEVLLKTVAVPAGGSVYLGDL